MPDYGFVGEISQYAGFPFLALSPAFGVTFSAREIEEF
jgi:hypothetical protein